MSSPRRHKVLADLKVSRSRTILAILSIAIGIFAVGTVLTTREAVNRSVEDSFDSSNPASAVLSTEPFDTSVVAAVQALPEIGDAEGRVKLEARLQKSDGSWLDLDLNAIADFNNIRVDRVLPESGAWPPATGELLIERASRANAGVAIGDLVVIELPGGAQHTLRVGGVAYDPGQVAPDLGDGRLASYITLDTLITLGQPVMLNELHLLAATDPRDVQRGELVGGIARDQVLEPIGIAVHRIAVHDTPRFHSVDLGSAMMLILGLLGGLILLLGVFLIINTISALLAQQVRQIGMMKAIGGRRPQIVLLYLGLTLAYGAIAVIIAAPLGALAAWQFASVLAEMLNLELRGPWLPSTVVAIELGLGLLVPMLAALVPVMCGTRISVREALTSYGLADRGPAGGVFDRAIERLRGVPRPVRLSIRNTFRRRSRLALTLVTLTLGGAIFASVTTVRTSLESTLDGVMQYSAFDVQVSLRQPEVADSAIRDLETLPGVEHAEGWIATNASRARPDGTQNSNIWLMAAPAGTNLIRPTLVEGRWLQQSEGEALVVNVDFRGDEPDIQVGDVVTLKVEGHEIHWPVVGIVSSQLMGPVVYAPYEPLSKAIGMASRVNRIMLVGTRHDGASQEELASLAAQTLQTSGLPVVQAEAQNEMRSGTQSAFDMLVMVLLIVGVLLVAVGSLGLMGAMSLNVIERTREIGVMRAIGASNSMVARIVITEGLIVGLMSWLLGGLLALPLSWGLGHVIGVAFVKTPLTYAFSATGLLLWLVLVLVISVVASVMPARSAWRLSVREVLAYE
jgi:putative ABC transport system permease protein